MPTVSQTRQIVHDHPGYQRAEAVLIKRLADLGVYIHIGTDMRDFHEIVAKHLPDRVLTQPFCPGSVFEALPAIWIAGFDAAGRLVHTQATRLVCPDPTSFAEYFPRNFQHFPPPVLAIDFEKSVVDLNPSLKALHGRICYHGEVWLYDSPQYRGGRAIGLTGALNFVAALQRLRADAFFGLMTKALGDKGLVNRQGYVHASADCLTWHRLDGAPPIRTYIAHQTKEDVGFLMNKAVQ